MCMETETGGRYTVRLAWRGRNDIGAGKEEDDDLLALLFYFVFWRITAPITHPLSQSYTHTASTEVGALWSILGVHFKKLMCMDTETGGGCTVRLAWRGRNDIRASEVGDGTEREEEIVGSPLGGYD